jgi:hypothetical protein
VDPPFLKNVAGPYCRRAKPGHAGCFRHQFLAGLA